MSEYHAEERVTYPVEPSGGLRTRLSALAAMATECDKRIDELVSRLSPLLIPQPEEPTPTALLDRAAARGPFSGMSADAESTLDALRRLSVRIASITGALDL